MKKITKLPKKWTVKWDGNICNSYIKNNILYFDYYSKDLDEWEYNQKSDLSIEEYIDAFNNNKVPKEERLAIIQGLKEEEFNEWIKEL